MLKGTRESRRLLLLGAITTAVGAVLFPRLHHVIYEDGPIWEFDSEARVLAPLLFVTALLLFLAVGAWAWRGSSNRLATTALVCGVLAVIGVLAFFVSAPVIFGGMAITHGVEGRRRSVTANKKAVAGIVLGSIGAAMGASIWLFELA